MQIILFVKLLLLMVLLWISFASLETNFCKLQLGNGRTRLKSPADTGGYRAGSSLLKDHGSLSVPDIVTVLGLKARWTTSDFYRRWSVENTAPSSEQLLILSFLLLLKSFSHCGPCLKVPNGGKPLQAGTTRRSERNSYSRELGWIFREITPSLQDAIICNFLALSQISEKRGGLGVISPKASSEGLIRTCCTLWT